MYHRFWDCYHSMCFWKELGSVLGARVAIPPRSLCTQSSLASWMLQWLSEAKEEEKTTMIQGLYALWLARNDARDGKRIEEAGLVARRVVTLMEEWKRVRGTPEVSTRSLQHAIWEPPEAGWLKANVDGATARSGLGGGGGVVFRDEDGAFRGADAVFFPDTSTAEVTELLACKRAVLLALQRDVPKLHLETDCLAVARMLNDQERNLSSVGIMVEEVKTMARNLGKFKVTWVRRTANKAAHELARFGLCNRASVSWDLAPPDCILSIVSDELPNLV